MRKDNHRAKMGFLVQRINEISEWRDEAIKHAWTHQNKKARIEARVLKLREAAERNL